MSYTQLQQNKNVALPVYCWWQKCYFSSKRVKLRSFVLIDSIIINLYICVCLSVQRLQPNRKPQESILLWGEELAWILISDLGLIWSGGYQMAKYAISGLMKIVTLVWSQKLSFYLMKSRVEKVRSAWSVLCWVFISK